MQKEFLDAMPYLWPHGVDTVEQWRSIIRVFVMGWMSALMDAGAEATLTRVSDLAASMTGPDWVPDSSWQWWSGPTPR